MRGRGGEEEKEAKEAREARRGGRIILHGLVLNHDCVLTKKGGPRETAARRVRNSRPISGGQAEPDSISRKAIKLQDKLDRGEDYQEPRTGVGG